MPKLTKKQIYYINRQKRFAFFGGITPPPVENAFIATFSTNASTEVNIPLSTTETYDFNIEWGDGTQESFTGDTLITHTYAVAGDYDVKISGIFPYISFKNGTHKNYIKDIKSWGTIKWKSLYQSFWGCTNLGVISATDSPDLSECTGAESCFNACPNLSINMNWDMPECVNLNYFMYNCPSQNGTITINAPKGEKFYKSFMLNSSQNKNIHLSIGKEATKNIDIRNMFNSLESMTADITLDQFSTIYKYDAAYMFISSNIAFNPTINIPEAGIWNMYKMFSGCTNFNKQYNINMSKTTGLGYLMENCINYNQPLTLSLDIATDIQFIFHAMRKMNSDINLLNTNSLATIRAAFQFADDFTANFFISNSSNITNMEAVFWDSNPNFNPDISSWGWDFTNITIINNLIHLCSLSPANYSKLLIELDSQNVPSGLTFNSAGVKYDSTGEAARQSLIDNKGWNISDGGLV